MNCRRVKKSLMEYAEGGLDESRRDQVGQHLASCAQCSGLAERLSLSAAALSTLEPLRMPEEAYLRLGVRTASEGGSRSGAGLLRSPRALTAAGLVAAALIAIAVVVGITVPGGPVKDTGLSQKAQQTMAAGATGKEAETNQPVVPGAIAAIPLPVAKITGNNYDSTSITTMAEGLDIKRQFGERYSLDDAVNLRVAYIRKICDEFALAGGDGPMLEAMIGYIERTEPVVLPCYAEQARFTGRVVIIIGLCGPPRSGSDKQLTRTEFWAFDPGTFTTDPDTSMVWWGQSIKQ
jgi:hypothetical protein